MLAEGQTPISVIQIIVGHVNPEMTRHYTHIRDEAKRKALESLGPVQSGYPQKYPH